MSSTSKKLGTVPNFLDRHPKRWLRLTVLWMIVLYVLSTPYFSSQRTTDKLNLGFNIRFIAHLIVYFILGFLASGAIRLNFNWKQKFLIILLFCLLYSLSDEFHQHLAPERKFRLIDLSYDAIGYLAGILTYYSVYLRWGKREP